VKRALLLLSLVALLSAGAGAVQLSPGRDSATARERLRQALGEARMAEARSKRLESDAARAVEAADKTARQAAALAARIQQAEAGIAVAQARLALVGRERRALREELGAEQRPVVRLTAALEQFARRPVALSV
jgi:chromosome segregation ATPase